MLRQGGAGRTAAAAGTIGVFIIGSDRTGVTGRTAIDLVTT